MFSKNMYKVTTTKVYFSYVKRFLMCFLRRMIAQEQGLHILIYSVSYFLCI